MEPRRACKVLPNTRREQWVGAVELDEGSPPHVSAFYAHNSQQHAEAVRRFAIFPRFKVGERLNANRSVDRPQGGGRDRASRTLADYVAQVRTACDLVKDRLEDTTKQLSGLNMWKKASRRVILDVLSDLLDGTRQGGQLIAAVEPPSGEYDRQLVDDWRNEYLKFRDTVETAVRHLEEEVNSSDPFTFAAERLQADFAIKRMGTVIQDVQRKGEVIGTPFWFDQPRTAPLGGEGVYTRTEEHAVPSETTDGDRIPTVFVSYAHDSERHKHDVLAFAHILELSGIATILDQWDGEMRRDWSSWAIRGMTEADYVLIVASPDYRRAGDGLASAAVNRGVRSETSVLRDLLHADRDSWLPKLLPIVLPGHTIDEIPLFLQPYSADHYVIPEMSGSGVEELVRVITRQPAHVRPPRGPIPVLPPHPTSVSATPPPSAQPWAPLSCPASAVWHADFFDELGPDRPPALSVHLVPVGERSRLRITVLESLAGSLAKIGRDHGVFDLSQQLAIETSDVGAWAMAVDQHRESVGILVLRDGQRSMWSSLPKARLGRLLIREDVVSRISDSIATLLSVDVPLPARLAPAIGLEPLAGVRIGTRADLTASSASLHSTSPLRLRLDPEEEFSPAHLRDAAQEVAEELTARLFAAFRRECR